MIPRIIHQSWKDEIVPERWRAFQQSWRDHHPSYEYRFWTDAANRAFIRDYCPEFLGLYDGYAIPINRADLARYLVVRHYGGIYADMDFESLKPLDALIEGNSLVFACEPASHVDNEPARVRGFKQVVCNAFFAGAPRHEFWDHFLPALFAASTEANVLEVAGPYALTRAYESYARKQDISMAPSAWMYPIDNRGRPPGGGELKDALASAYAVHHWHGTWCREALLEQARRKIVQRRALS